ncbi:MAG TPA: histidinol dehydrogenase [Candidatus Bathyarchaeia archaeon]|nr:histidinol dehydrogenase [Candidatus Bathyarchaeia archaeon]
MVTLLEITDEDSAARIADRLTRSGAEAQADEEQKLRAVAEIVEAVKTRGDEAVAEYTQRFDGVTLRPEQFELSPEEIDLEVAKVDPALIAVLTRAHANIKAFHAKHLRQSWEESDDDGTVLGQRLTPLERAGVYVPGGKAFYASSVLMNITPASVAGVKEIVMVSPPSFEGGIQPVVLAAARVAGATRVFRIGGAQAVAALAYGTPHVPQVLKITGPGNIYVALAKRLVKSVVDIDSEAGPSEVVVIADERANPACVAAEMIAQAEHDEEVTSILLTPSKNLADEVVQQLAAQTAAQPRKAIIEQALSSRGLVIVVRDIEEAVRLSDLIAPEHLSIQTEFPRKVFDKVRNAGAVMLGASTPVAVGDYYAGPNHILPTGRRARFLSPLTAEDFRKVTSVIGYSQERLRKDAEDICMLARAEGLEAHAAAVEVRL